MSNHQARQRPLRLSATRMRFIFMLFPCMIVCCTIYRMAVVTDMVLNINSAVNSDVFLFDAGNEEPLLLSIDSLVKEDEHHHAEASKMYFNSNKHDPRMRSFAKPAPASDNAVRLDDTLSNTTTNSMLATTRTHNMKQRRSFSYLIQPTANLSAPNNTFSGVWARSFAPWHLNDLPCLPQRNNMNKKRVDGMFYVRIPKSGSSTCHGVHLRMARNEARRRIMSSRHDDLGVINGTGSTSSSINGPATTSTAMCDVIGNCHRSAYGAFPNRDFNNSMLWTTLRDPTSRYVSKFFHFKVAREQWTPNAASFRKMMDTDLDPYVKWLSPEMKNEKIARQLFESTDYQRHDDDGNNGDDLHPELVRHLNKIVQYFDFIAVQERMDESLVAMSMIFHVPLGDILHLSAKQNGGYDDGEYKKKCVIIPPSIIPPDMMEYIESSEYQRLVLYDFILHQVANRSLDMTILSLGRELFEHRLAIYRKANERAEQLCLPTTIFPCAANGTKVKTTDCLLSDMGCGASCLDKVAKELKIDERENVYRL